MWYTELFGVFSTLWAFVSFLGVVCDVVRLYAMWCFVCDVVCCMRCGADTPLLKWFREKNETT
jgi:hypothetical protein